MPSTTKGIILLAFGKKEYVYMACQMAMSIRFYSSEMHITVVVDDNKKYIPTKYNQFFTKVKDFANEDLYLSGKINPGWAKCNVDKYIECDENIYLDVDGICIQDLSTLFGVTDKYFATEITGTGKIDDTINYSFWAKNNDIWEYFKLKDEQQYSAIQSSFMYLRKGKETTTLFNKIRENFNFPMDKLLNHWGGTMPDELIIAGTCAELGHEPKFPKSVVFFGHKMSKLSLTEIQAKFYVNSLYGNGIGATLVKDIFKEWYNRMAIKISRHFKIPLIHKAFQLMRTKHAGGKKV